MSIKVLEEVCTLCGECVKSCPLGAVSLTEEKIEIAEDCNLCGACVEACPFEAIKIAVERLVLDSDRGKKFDLSAYKHILVFAEQREGNLMGVALELVGKARELADELGVDVSAALLGEDVKDLSSSLIEAGADKIFLAEDSLLKDYRGEAYTKVMVDLIGRIKPEIVLLGATTIGRALAPRIAARLKTGLTADCTGLSIGKERELLQTRPAFGGNIMATIACSYTRPQMATVRPRVFKKPPLNSSRSGEIIAEKVDLKEEDLTTRILKIVKEVGQGPKIEEAEIIVSAGRGLSDPKNLRLVEDLASALGGAVGASRAIVDANWIDSHHQVGQTGKTVCPKLYIACGISGAVQHLVGMSSSDCIV
ncbi:electron transfer flavoprotein subunit alpha, partial [bacterium]|nr:electron transfer flavoprotein subunit alpha [bacterium]